MDSVQATARKNTSVELPFPEKADRLTVQFILMAMNSFFAFMLFEDFRRSRSFVVIAPEPFAILLLCIAALNAMGWFVSVFRRVADDTGLHTNFGFYKCDVRWEDVGFYTLDERKYQSRLTLHAATGRVLADVRAPLRNEKQGAQIQQFLDLIKAKLNGKKVDGARFWKAPSENHLAAAWRDLKRRRTIYRASWWVAIVANPLCAWIFVHHYLQLDEWYFYVLALLVPGMLATFVIVAFTMMFLITFSCPRCREPFGSAKTMNVEEWRQCAYCKLPLWATEDEAKSAE